MGDGKKQDHFYILMNVDATRALMKSNFSEPINIGSEEMVSINELAQLICEIANKNLKIKHIDGPLGEESICC